MNIKDHGRWAAYRPDPRPEGLPASVLFARRESDGKDWYEYIREEGAFQEGSIKLTVFDGDVVGAAVFEADRLWPGYGQRVLEIIGITSADPQKEFGNKLYDQVTSSFAEPPPPPAASPQGPTTAELLERIKALEAKG